MIPDAEVERVRETADIASIIGEYVELRRMGADFRGPCPFHQGTHRNFSVSPRKGMYYCFVCHESGDVFTFIQKRLGMDWPDAVRLVAGKVGIELHETRARQEGPDPRTPYWEANAAAAEYFQQVLWGDEAGKPARAYLAQRAVDKTLADKFGMGFAPRDPAPLRARLAALGIPDETLIEAGLVVRRPDETELRPRFRNRLIFPILDLGGKPVGFGGRLIAPGEPKYLNTGESPVYSKGSLLYNLHQARLAARREERIFLVEGYFDVLRLVGAGVEPVVAPLGTALTEGQAQLLKRYAASAFLLYDSDKAGLKATFRAGDMLLAQGVSVRVITLPEGDDPDTYVRKHGREAIERAAAASLDVFERKIQILERGGWFADLHKRRKAIDHLLPTIRACADPVTREIYLARAAEVSGVDREVLQREAESVRKRAQPQPTPEPVAPPVESRGPQPTSRARRRPKVVAEPAERELVRAMLHDRGVVERVTERCGPDSFQVPELREIFATLLNLGSEASVEELAHELSEPAVQAMQELLDTPDAIQHLQRTVDDSLSRLDQRRLEERNAEIMSLLATATGGEKDALLLEKERNRREIGQLRALREQP
ncbi:MAG: DNA primase [Gemmatimonadetes bacterium]|nr:DNA primase [Gemmatimonadota bacterium]